MKTELIYLTDSYKKESEAKILEVEVINDKLSKVILDQTIFFAEGGGQPSDQGFIIKDDIKYKVLEVRLEQGEIKHFINTSKENIEKGKCYLEVDWARRYKNMQIHTSGHIVDWAISELKLHGDQIEPVEGSHGKKAYLAYKGSAKKIDKSDIQKRVNQIIEKNLKITVKLVSLEELKKEALYVFDNLPKDKPLRVVTLEGYKSVPDGGTLVKSTGEIESIIIESIEDIKDDEFRVNYSTKITKPKSFTAPKITTDDSQKITEKIKKLKDSASKEVGEISTLQMIEKAKIKYLGRKSELVQILRMLKDLPYDIRGEIGKQSNDLKEFLTSLIEKKEEKLKSDKFNETLKEEWLDVTVPVNTEGIGHVHPLTQMLWRVTDIFQSMGFEVIEPTEIDNDFNHFTALNIPENHPARDMWDTFWTKDGRIATAHTSTMQNRILSRIKPPIRAIIPGRCFRNEATDSSHEHTFYQVEGIYLDKNINLTHLVSTIRTFLEAFFEREVRLKIQPTYFPFVEPALEVMMERPGFKKNDNKYNKSEWLELMPCGPIHPNVLKLAGIDPDEYSGFAWGLGLDRLVMVKYGIEDIRHFHGGDLRFLSQF